MSEKELKKDIAIIIENIYDIKILRKIKCILIGIIDIKNKKLDI